MTNDSISDMLTRIRNSYKVNKPNVLITKTKLTEVITKILQREGFITSFVEFNTDLKLDLKYKNANGSITPAITCLKRISKPGLRVYTNKYNIPKVLGGLGIALISTSDGILTDRQARQRQIGGEVLCFIW